MCVCVCVCVCVCLQNYRCVFLPSSKKNSLYQCLSKTIYPSSINLQSSTVSQTTVPYPAVTPTSSPLSHAAVPYLAVTPTPSLLSHAVTPPHSPPSSPLSLRPAGQAAATSVPGPGPADSGLPQSAGCPGRGRGMWGGWQGSRGTLPAAACSVMPVKTTSGYLPVPLIPGSLFLPSCLL